MTEPFKTYDPNWWDYAACKGEDASVFFFEDTAPNHKARRLCINCPVRIDCLEYAVEHEKDFGVWAGVTARVRLTLRRAMNKTKSKTVVELLSKHQDVVLDMYPAPKRQYRRTAEKHSPISTNEMFVSLIEAAKIRYKNQSKE